MATRRTMAQLERALKSARRQVGALKRQLAHSSALELSPTDAIHTTHDRGVQAEALADSRQRLAKVLADAQALYTISGALAGPGDLDAKLGRVVDLMAELLELDRVVIITIEQTKGQIRGFYRGGPGVAATVEVSYDELSAGLTGWVLRERRPALSPAGRPDPRESPEVQRRRVATNCGDIVVVPICFQQQLFGTLTAINSPGQRRITATEVELMTSLANQIAVAIENHNLYQAMAAEVQERQRAQAELQRAYEHIERKVAERTAALNEARRLSQSTLDALGEHICVLDEGCTIVAVNRAWHDFATANPPVAPDHYVGANYLRICERATGAYADEAALFAAGLRAVLRGEREQFSLEYPCDTPWGEERWFLAKVTRFAGEGQTRLVVAHANITQQKLTRVELQRQHDYAAALLMLSQALDGAGSYEEVLSATQAQLAAGLRLEQVSFYIFDESQAYAWSLAAGGAAPEFAANGPVALMPVKGDRRLEALVQAADLLFEGAGEAALASSPPDGGVVTAYVPLLLNGLRIGALAVGPLSAERARTISGQERNFLAALARNVAATLERIRVGAELKSLFATMADGMVYQNAEGQITFANPAAERILGHSLGEMRGRSFLDPCCTAIQEDGTPFPGEQHPSFLALRSGQPVLNTVMGLQSGADAPIRWVVVNATPQLRPGERTPHQIFTTFTDITERRRAEEDRRESEERLRSFIEQSSEGAVMTDEAGRILEWNRALEGLTGYGREEVLGMAFWDVQAALAPPGHDRKALAQAMRQLMEPALRSGQASFFGKPVDGVLLARDGQLKSILQTSFPIKSDQGYRIGSVVRDITEQKQDEARLLMLGGALEAAANAIVIMDGEGLIQWANQAFTTLTGYELEETIGRQPRELIGTDSQDSAFSAERWASIRSGQVWKGELLNRRKDGSLYEEELTITPLLDERGRIKHFIEIKQDVSARKRSEAALIESEEKYRSLIESLEAVIATVDADGVYHYMNRIAAAALGGTPEALVGRSMRDLFPPELAEPQLRHIRQVIATGVGLVSEARSLVAGKPRWYRTSIQPVRDAAGAVTVALVNAMDITQRKAAEIVLEERVEQRTAEIESIRQRLELATRSAGIGIWDWNCESGQILWDEQMLALYGITREAFAGTFAAWEQRVHPEDMPEQLERIQGALRREREFDTDFRVIWPDQSEHHLHAKALTLFDGEGRPLRMIGVNYDVTVRKNAELVLRQREETLQQANAELARANRTKDEFLANMSHELRTPLNGILALSEAMIEQTRGPLNERQLKSLQSIEASGRHLLSLINDILDVSKIEAGRLELAPDLLDLNDLGQASLAFVKEPATKKSVALHFHSDAPNLAILADGRRLKQILINLLSNAVKFTPAGGRVSLEVHANADEGVVSFAVEDTGIGIAPDDLPRLFTPFVQVDTSLTRQHEGTGLGLALVSRLARLHGGSVSVTSQLGQGSRFTVTLPWVANAATEIHFRHDDVTAGFARALVVENVPIAAEQLAAHLRQVKIEVQTQLRGDEALAHARAFQPQVIFLDLMMPDTSGWEVLAELKADPQTRAIPVVIVSILDEREEARRAGADEYLLKPYTRGQLQQVLRRLAERGPQPGGDTTGACRGERRELVLLVEDSPINIDSVSDYLQFHGYEVIVALNGQEGLELAEARRPDLILMDIQMPVMDGYEAMRRLRAMPGLETTPIIALTALAMAGDRERCMEAGASAYLSKPVSLKDLLALTRKLLSKEAA